jgi:tripartite ATP-independent transporter DctM subunit
MDWLASLALLLGLLTLLLMAGLPVAFAFLGVNVVGAFVFLGGEAGLSQLARNSASAITNFALTPIPLFILMGEVLFHTGVAFRAIEAIERLIARVPGRLAIVSVVGGTMFAALSGSSMANTALLGSVLLPEKLKRGYHPTLAMGPIMAVGGVAMLIPPSALAVLLGSLAGISIAELLIGGILPGLMMGTLFLGYVVVRCWLDPTLAPAYDIPRAEGWARWRPFLVNVMPLFVIFVVVIGSMLAGWATPTESAALGSFAAVVAAIAYRALTRANLAKSLNETAKISVMILFIIVASSTFSQILAFSGATNGLLALFSQFSLSRTAVVVLMQAVLLFLGCFVDQVSMIMITLPFFMPLAKTVGINELWLGILILISMEISFITPPFGLLLFVMQGVAPKGTKLSDIYRAALPYLALEIAVLVLLIIWPELATWMPSMLREQR